MKAGSFSPGPALVMGSSMLREGCLLWFMHTKRSQPPRAAVLPLPFLFASLPRLLPPKNKKGGAQIRSGLTWKKKKKKALACDEWRVTSGGDQRHAQWTVSRSTTHKSLQQKIKAAIGGWVGERASFA
jgi:hypothetical protein